METIFIGLGSNLGDSTRTLRQAWDTLTAARGVSAVELSPPFRSAPVAMASGHRWFTNAVGRLTTTLAPHDLLELLLTIEAAFGRLRDRKSHGYQDRTLDLDLLYFGSHLIDDSRLTVPHPRRSERLFVLAPLSIIASDFVDPQMGISVRTMYEALMKTMTTDDVAMQEIAEIAWP